jgi:hypothetical protein
LIGINGDQQRERLVEGSNPLDQRALHKMPSGDEVVVGRCPD